MPSVCVSVFSHLLFSLCITHLIVSSWAWSKLSELLSRLRTRRKKMINNILHILFIVPEAGSPGCQANYVKWGHKEHEKEAGHGVHAEGRHGEGDLIRLSVHVGPLQQFINQKHHEHYKCWVTILEDAGHAFAMFSLCLALLIAVWAYAGDWRDEREREVRETHRLMSSSHPAPDNLHSAKNNTASLHKILMREIKLNQQSVKKM